MNSSKSKPLYFQYMEVSQDKEDIKLINNNSVLSEFHLSRAVFPRHLYKPISKILSIEFSKKQEV